MKSFSGCWTCRLRHKKCDEGRPVCGVCAALHITCYFDSEKPEWMDGGARQEEMAKALKAEVKENAHLRQRAFVLSSPAYSAASGSDASGKKLAESPVGALHEASTPEFDLVDIAANPSSNDGLSVDTPVRSPIPTSQHNINSPAHSDGSVLASWPDARLLVFYMDHLLPFLFPFYCPSTIEGGRSWLLEIMASEPAMQKTTLSQSSYLFLLALENTNSNCARKVALIQTKHASKILQDSMRSLCEQSISENLRHAVMIMTRMTLVSRFEAAISSLEDYHEQLNATTSVLNHILNSVNAAEGPVLGLSFEAVASLLGSSECVLSSQTILVPSVEQSAFRFSSALVVLEDLLASLTLQEQPKLYQHHHFLLCSSEHSKPQINFKAVVGCENWVILLLGEVAALDAWKQRCKAEGNLDIMELVHRATNIKDGLMDRLNNLEQDPTSAFRSCIPKPSGIMLGYGQWSNSPGGQGIFITRVWAHAALAYLSVVVSGWQPANQSVRNHVAVVVDLLTNQLSLTSSLRAMAWPFYISACLANQEEASNIRSFVEELRPSGLFVTVLEAFEIVEAVWQNRANQDNSTFDLASCLRSQGKLLLLC